MCIGIMAYVSKQVYLRLAGCIKVTDVRGLGRQQLLNLSGTGVSDVRTLGNVHDLNLDGTMVRDVSGDLCAQRWSGQRAQKEI